MDETTLDRTAESLLTLLFFHHKELLKSNNVICGVEEAQFRILGHLIKEGTMSMSALGNRLYISKPYMTNLVDTLIKEGYVERNADMKDRRVINITITEHGIQYIESAKVLYKERVKCILSQLDDPDLAILCSSAGEVASILSKIIETPPCSIRTPHKEE